MNDGAYRDDDGADQPETYWRRRAFTLAAGLTVLGLLAWAFSGGSGKPPNPAAASSPAPSPAAQYDSASPPVAASAAASASAGADAAVPGLPSAAASGLPTPTATAQPRADPAATSAQSGGDCSPSSVVLSLFSARPSYSVREFPEFDIYAVSTAPGTCILNLGPGQLHLTVMSAGRVIWDSADCSRTDSSQDDQLSRGVPVQTSITWNRTITLPGCVTLASSARPGTYQAQVTTGAVASQVRAFTLVG